MNELDPSVSTPGADTSATATPPASPAPFDPRGRAPGDWEPRMLVVDDDPVCRLAAQRLLEKLGLAVDVAASGTEAVTMTARWRYAAIFMDCAMPEADGYSTTRKIRARAGLTTGPLVIAATSRPRHVCLASGMDYHIPKPLRLDALRADCTTLGLIAPGDDTAADPRAERPQPADGEPPLLMARPGLTESRTAELAEAFVQRAVPYLPGLWRASNSEDLDSLQRIAAELKRRAMSVGAVRVSELCDELSAAGARGRAELATGLQLSIREAVRQTGAAARAQLNPRAATHDTPVPAVLAAPPAPTPEPAPVRVVIADDDPLARLAIEAMINHGERLELVGSATDVPEIVALVGDRRPDVAVLDFQMPGGGGPEAARQIRQRSPQTRVVALTASDGPDAYLAMLQAGASGLLVKGSSADRLVEMIHLAYERSGA
jgi:CheY-like chemotaxis protein